MSYGVEPNELAPDTYWAWCETAWKFQAGSIEALGYLRAKLNEERREFDEALRGGRPEEIVSEAGDFLWVLTAAGCNYAVPIPLALSEYLPDNFKKGQPVSFALIDEVAVDLVDPVTPAFYEHALKVRTAKLPLGYQVRHATTMADFDNPQNFYDAYQRVKRGRIIDILAECWLITAAAVQYQAQTNGQQVAKENMRKINERIAQGLPVAKPPRLAGS